MSLHEEASTLMILHATESAKGGSAVHIYSQDTDVLILALRRVPVLGRNPAMVMGTSDRRRIIPLLQIYDALGEAKAEALCKWHAVTGCDTAGLINGKSKKACLDAFLKAGSSTVASTSALGVGEKPSDQAPHVCIGFLSGLFCKKDASSTNPEQVRWMSFKQLGKDKGVELLPPTHGAWEQHVLRTHLQSYVWEQDLSLHPTLPNPVSLGWNREKGGLKPLLSKVPSAPEAVVELVKCSCSTAKKNPSSKCVSARFSCRLNMLTCTELCHCEADTEICQNVDPDIDSDEG